jgi:hypothetical protein
MTQSQPLRLQAKRANCVVGWLLAVPVGFLWLLAITFAFLSLVALSQIGVKEPMDLFGFGAFALVIGLICLLASLLTGKLHDALAVYEFTPQDVSKRSPFREQRANWSEVAGWAISESDGIWWLLDTKGRVLLSLEWHTLPEEQVPAAKAFVVDHLRRRFLAMPSAPQTLLSRLRRFRRLSLWAASLLFAGFIGYWLTRKAGDNVIAMIAVMALIAGILLGGVSIFSVFGRGTTFAPACRQRGGSEAMGFMVVFVGAICPATRPASASGRPVPNIPAPKRCETRRSTAWRKLPTVASPRRSSGQRFERPL